MTQTDVRNNTQEAADRRLALPQIRHASAVSTAAFRARLGCSHQTLFSPRNLPKELRKSAIFLMLLVITSIYSRFAQSWWISRCTGSSWPAIFTTAACVCWLGVALVAHARLPASNKRGVQNDSLLVSRFAKTIPFDSIYFRFI